MNTQNLKVVLNDRGETPGEEFKRIHGYSRTMAKLMRKNNCSTVEEYRQVRKKNRRK